jgi:hypothetical protein
VDSGRRLRLAETPLKGARGAAVASGSDFDGRWICLAVAWSARRRSPSFHEQARSQPATAGRMLAGGSVPTAEVTSFATPRDVAAKTQLE